MASPRTRRLMVDAELIRRRFANWPLIEISGVAGIPPEIYRFTYRVKGLYVDAGGSILERDMHLLEVNLSLDYPRRAPQCRMLTPVFHPNFDDASVCIGDFWAASEGLDELVIRIGRMIAYQEYNTRSPLNGLAAKWAAQNESMLPVDDRVIAPPSEAGPEGAGAASPQTVATRTDAVPAFVQRPTEGTHTRVETAADQDAEQGGDSSRDPWNEKIVIEA
jgi:ubiquitin-protein ligase